ncbi:hypothetical protein FW800_25690 [Pseudomonas sp. 910_23]|uniref:hypothetical protein n=1 Tax=Pseudomonas sp. 910_23 TaxID=2604461 RepID=UPI0040630533
MDAFQPDSLEADLDDGEDNAPVVSKALVRYMQRRFSADKALDLNKPNADQHLGFLKGQKELMDHLSMLSNRRN